MGCDIGIYREKQLSYDRSTSTEVIERETLLDLKTWTLGEMLTQETECPNGSITTVSPEQVLDALLSYEQTDECKNDEDISEEIKDCISKVKLAETQPDGCLAVSVWY